MPEEVITNILLCLPLHDVVKTSILSKDWKFKWTMITQLAFDKNFYDYLDQNTDNEYLYPKIISRLLFLLNSAITKFFLYLPYCNEVDVEDINCWIIYLSKKGIKEFKGSILTPYKAGVPASFNLPLPKFQGLSLGFFDCQILADAENRVPCVPVKKVIIPEGDHDQKL
ncbi:F-box/FBD/LRR-repeat protein-like protein isoform X2 [Tanacetum coccineum]